MQAISTQDEEMKLVPILILKMTCQLLNGTMPRNIETIFLPWIADASDHEENISFMQFLDGQTVDQIQLRQGGVGQIRLSSCCVD